MYHSYQQKIKHLFFLSDNFGQNFKYKGQKSTFFMERSASLIRTFLWFLALCAYSQRALYYYYNMGTQNSHSPSGS